MTADTTHHITAIKSAARKLAEGNIWAADVSLAEIDQHVDALADELGLSVRAVQEIDHGQSEDESAVAAKWHITAIHNAVKRLDSRGVLEVYDREKLISHADALAEQAAATPDTIHRLHDLIGQLEARADRWKRMAELHRSERLSREIAWLYSPRVTEIRAQITQLEAEMHAAGDLRDDEGEATPLWVRRVMKKRNHR